MSRDEVLKRLRAHREALQERGIASLAVFGSVARGTAGPGSDVDLLVEFSKPVGLFEFVRIKNYLSGLLGTEVDLVTPDALKPGIRDEILEEAIRAA